MSKRRGDACLRAALAAALFILACPSLVRAATAPLPADSFAARLLAAHNRARAEVGVPPLVWDDELAASAAEWAKYIAGIGALVHAPDEGKFADDPGENLWGGTRGAYTPEEMVGLWLSERDRYKPGRFPDVSTTGNLADVTHYTQIVWRRTTRLGCALAEAEQDDFLVCRYLVGGNTMGQRPY